MSSNVELKAGALPLTPLVICGPSGVGKGTMIERLKNQFEGRFGYSVSHTTRLPRKGEVDGVNYHFTNIENMKELIEKNNFIEYANVHGNMYGTSRRSVEAVQKQNQICLLEIDVQGARQVFSSGISAHYLFISPPSIDSLRQRLEGRKSESKESLELRLKNATQEIEVARSSSLFESTIINDELDLATTQMFDVVMDWYPTLNDSPKQDY